MSTSPDFVTREVERLVSGAWVSDGAGVKLLRALTPLNEGEELGFERLPSSDRTV